eukprot:9481773-Pyramimonas_sp.AAC.1
MGWSRIYIAALTLVLALGPSSVLSQTETRVSSFEDLQLAVGNGNVQEIILVQNLTVSTNLLAVGMEVRSTKVIRGDKVACGNAPCELNMNLGDGSGPWRLMYVHEGGDLTLRDLVVKGGELFEMNDLSANGAS